MKYRGIIIEESLVDNRILNNMVVFKMYITSAENKNDRWHLFEVEIDDQKCIFYVFVINTGKKND